MTTMPLPETVYAVVYKGDITHFAYTRERAEEECKSLNLESKIKGQAYVLPLALLPESMPFKEEWISSPI